MTNPSWRHSATMLAAYTLVVEEGCDEAAQFILDPFEDAGQVALGEHVERARAERTAELVLREVAPAVLERAGLDTIAASLRLVRDLEDGDWEGACEEAMDELCSAVTWTPAYRTHLAIQDATHAVAMAQRAFAYRGINSVESVRAAVSACLTVTRPCWDHLHRMARAMVHLEERMGEVA